MPTQHVSSRTTSATAHGTSEGTSNGTSSSSGGPAHDDVVDEAQVLVEDVSIDGMCGVY